MFRRCLLPVALLRSAISLGAVSQVCRKQVLPFILPINHCFATMAYKPVERGSKNTDNYRIYIGENFYYFIHLHLSFNSFIYLLAWSWPLLSINFTQLILWVWFTQSVSSRIWIAMTFIACWFFDSFLFTPIKIVLKKCISIWLLRIWWWVVMMSSEM